MYALAARCDDVRAALAEFEAIGAKDRVDPGRDVCRDDAPVRRRRPRDGHRHAARADRHGAAQTVVVISEIRKLVLRRRANTT
jgi:hypothetical protein